MNLLRLGVITPALLVFTLTPVQAGEIETRSTGVGLEARSPRPDYPLKLVFSNCEGPLVVDIEVRIWNDEGDLVLTEEKAGPWLFVDLPPGRYAVRAQRTPEKTTSANVEVPATGQRTLILSFPPMRDDRCPNPPMSIKNQRRTQLFNPVPLGLENA